MPPSLSVSVGVPPGVTVTASLVSSVSVTVLPASRSPLEGLSTSDEIVGVVVSICGPVWVRPVSDRLAALPAPSCDGAAVEIDRGGGQRRGVLPGANRVAEGQRSWCRSRRYRSRCCRR